MASTTTSQVASPDGRRWTLAASHTRRHLSNPKDQPFFAAHAFATVILVLLFAFAFEPSWSGWLEYFVPLVIVVWLNGILGSTLNRTIEANTPGPPPEHRKWTVTKRFKGKQAMAAVTAAIQHGQISIEPEGTRLTEI